MENITLTNKHNTVQINPLGAELFSLKNSSGTEYIWEGNPDFWGKHSPILFPIVGTLKNNSYRYEGNEYQLSRHGFARECPFEVKNKTTESVVFVLKSNTNSLKLYPFGFELHIKYQLKDKKVLIFYKVINQCETKMPFCIGGHPAIALPGNFTDYSLEFCANKTLEYHVLTEGLIANETKTIVLEHQKLLLNYDTFKNDALVFKQLESKTITIHHKQNPYLKFSFDDFPNFGIWTVQKAPFICLEPWFGYSDTENKSGDLFTKEGIQILNPHEEFNAMYSIEIL